MLHIPGLFIAESPLGGRGVFTALPLQPGDVIEVCPTIALSAQDVAHIDNTPLYDYYFSWPEPPGSARIALGYGSLYNHSFQPNAEVILDLPDNTIVIKCLTPIDAGHEITIDYTGVGRDNGSLWFEVTS